MVNDENIVAAKLVYTLIWMFFATYYFGWGRNEVTVVQPIDDSGWVPDGALAAAVTGEGDEGEVDFY